MTSESEHLLALRQLCELLHRPTPARLRAGLSVDWSNYPRIAAILPDSNREATPELVGQRVRELLEEAYRDLHPLFPSSEAQLSSLDVLRIHLLEGQSWDAITTGLLENGTPISARTLRSRQKDALEVVLNWAVPIVPASVAEEGAQDSGEGVERVPRGSVPAASRAVRVVLLASAALVLLVSAGWLWINNGQTAEFRLHPSYIGKPIVLEPGQVRLPEPFPQFELPAFDTRVLRALFVPLANGDPGLLLITLHEGEHRGQVGLYDVKAMRMRWLRTYDPPTEEIMTHATLPPEAQLELFRPQSAYYGDHSMNLGRRVAVVYAQKFSPCFVVTHSIDTGEILGHYVHPGRLECGAVLDLNDDGAPELLLGGTENTFVPPRPVAVALDPARLSGAASTVQWRTTRGEDALVRTVLPNVPPVMDFLDCPRLVVLPFELNSWNPRERLISLKVGDGRALHRSVYQVYLRGDLRPLEPTSVYLGENERLLWERAGLERDFTKQLDREIVVISGR